jgi:nucleotide sugar dehydrogenase
MKISVIGLGFVGFPLYISILNTKSKISSVIGLEDNSKKGKIKIKKILQTKKNYFNNKQLDYLFNRNKKKINVSTNYKNLIKSDFIFVCIPFHIDKNLKTNEKSYFLAIKKYYLVAKKNSIIILNSTLPPGYTKNLITKFKKQNIYRKDVGIVFSPERVEPGLNYLKSIVDSPRVFSSNSNHAISQKIKKLFSIIFNTKKFKPIELKKYEEAELCKILENSYRAANIAFIEEWGILAEKLGINIYSILDAIKQRKTHSNIMKPGLGVGGYCLTKDPYFAKFSSLNYLSKKIEFPFIDLSMKTNLQMHSRSISILRNILIKHKIKKILIIGISYTNNVDDLRNSRGIDMLKFIKTKKINTHIYDEAMKQNKILGSKVLNKISKINDYDCIILINKSSAMKKINLNKIKRDINLLDLNNVLDEKEIDILSARTKNLTVLGRGDI